jgi:hypothetical protein
MFSIIAGRAEAERARIADVQRNDLVTLPFELLRASGQPATDLVFDVAQAFAGANL